MVYNYGLSIFFSLWRYGFRSSRYLGFRPRDSRGIREPVKVTKDVKASHVCFRRQDSSAE